MEISFAAQRKHLLYLIFFLFLMLFPPALILHIYSFEQLIQYPISLGLIYLAIKFSKLRFLEFNFIYIISFSLLVLLFFVKSNFVPIKFIYGLFVIALVPSMFYYQPKMRNYLILSHLLVAILFSFIILIEFSLDVFGYKIQYTILTDYFRNYKFVKLNPFFGIEKYSGRYTSFFTEPNRFAFFLTIPFVITLLSKKKIGNYFILFLLGFSIFLTKSLFAAVTIIFAIFLYFFGFKKRILLSALVIITIGYYNLESVLLFFGRTQSFNERIIATIDMITVINKYPLGVGASFDIKKIPGVVQGSTFTAINFWGVTGGYIALFLLAGLFIKILKHLKYLYDSSQEMEKMISIAFVPYLLQQIWLQDMFGYLFLFYFSLLISFEGKYDNPLRKT